MPPKLNGNAHEAPLALPPTVTTAGSQRGRCSKQACECSVYFPLAGFRMADLSDRTGLA